MFVRTALIAALAVVGIVGVPMAAAAQQADAVASADVARDAARMAVLDRFYVAIAMQDEAALAEMFDGVMIWIGDEGVRFVRPTSPAAPGAVFESVFSPGVGRYDSFGASASLYLPSGSHVVSLGSYSGYTRSTDDLMSTDFAHVFTFSEGRLSHFQAFTETAPWLRGTTPD